MYIIFVAWLNERISQNDNRTDILRIQRYFLRHSLLIYKMPLTKTNVRENTYIATETWMETDLAEPKGN